MQPFSYLTLLTRTKDGPSFPKHESVAIHAAYHFFSTHSEPEQDACSSPKLRNLFSNLAKVDFDAAIRFLVRISSPDSWNQNVRNFLDDLACFIIPNEFFPEDLRSKAMAALTSSIERKQFRLDLSTSLTQISHCLLCEIEPRGRDLRNTKLRLQANLFSIGSHKALTEVCAKEQSHLSLWIVVLQDAAWDDIVSSV